MKELFLIRHGHSVDNEFFRYSGFSDCDLSQIGRQQVEKMTDYFKQFDVERIYASTLKRTQQTIDAYAKLKNLDVECLDDLREMNFGIFDGLSFDEIKAKYPEEAKIFLSSGRDYRFPNGETLEEMYNRNTSAIEKIIKTNENVDSVAVVSHMGTIRNLLSYFISGSSKYHWNFKVGNASVTKISFDGRFPIIEYMGYMPYESSLIRTYPSEKNK
ncbi:histidine phosphatase family protein [Peptostreptococcus porci]|uniref:histidine phosphatase family protein n=1 Tax=Peptostreptococcus porci TaxID=2652282 RepID=UPI002A91955D|nr:histidine phosphatase family protein [Peptostreptococcus porci]MDY6232274.1 histidine phosphatase family protein [Peptostreptococcus porci]